MRERGPGLGNGCGVGENASVRRVSSVAQDDVRRSRIEDRKKESLVRKRDLHGAVDLGQISIWHSLRRLVADSQLETSRTPVDELNRALGLEARHGGVSFLGDNITTVQETSSHVFPVAGIALDHLVVWLEARHGDFLYAVGFVFRLASGGYRGVGNERKVNTWVWHKIGLEFVEIDVEGAIEAERSGNGRNDCTRLDI